MCNKIKHIHKGLKSDDELILNNILKRSPILPQKLKNTQNNPAHPLHTHTYTRQHTNTIPHTHTSSAKYVLFPPLFRAAVGCILVGTQS